MPRSGPWRPRLQSTLLGLGLFAAAQAGPLQPGTDLEIHRFLPAEAPEAAAPAALRAARSAAPEGLSSFAAQQIADLQAEKAARTPAQAKIDSRHLFTARMLQHQPAAPGVQYLHTDVELDAGDDLVVQISADVSPDLLDRLAAQGIQVVESHARYHSILALVPASQLELIAGWPDVHFLGPRAQPCTAGLAEGDVSHRAALARSLYGIDGSGLKIGVLSDGVANLAASQYLGALGPVTVLTVGNLLQTGVHDEGTAMLEIVHALAPGAQLYFATAFNSMQSFAENIRALRAAGCDILVDDVSYLTETRFQDGQAAGVVSSTNGGILAQAVNDVVAGGALYFSSAANDGNLDAGTAGVYEGDFVDGGAAGALFPRGGRVHQFAPGVPYDTLTAAGSGVNLTWADPLGAAADDYDLYVLDPTGTSVVASSTNLQNGAAGSDPDEYAATPAAGDRIVVVKYSGQARCFNLSTFRGQLLYRTAGATYGHNAASGAFTVAATPAAAALGPGYPVGPYPGAFTAAAGVEPFSSDGPRRLFFQADGTPLTPGNFSSTGGVALAKPDFTAADGVTVTGVGAFGGTFYGTSAAAPHAAAIAALVKSAAPAAGKAALAAALRTSAIDLGAAGWDRDSGAGILMADAAIQSLGLASWADLVVASAAAAENPGNRDGWLEAGEGAALPIQLRNLSQGPAATAITATLSSPVPGVVVALPATLAYPDLGPGAVAGGPAPFRFTLGAGFDPYATSAEFDLTLNFSGGSVGTKTARFLVPVGQLNLGGTLGAPAGASPWVAAATGSQTDRVSRTGAPSACGAAKAWPGVYGDGAARAFDAYTFTARHTACGEVQLAAQDAGLFLSVYSPGFVASAIGTNYVGDAGASSLNETLQVGFVAGQTYTVVVTQVAPGASAGGAYTLTLPGGLIRTGAINRAPVAIAKDLTLAAGAGGTAPGNVDNGSYDPDGDSLTYTQTPAGPYAIGATPVLLTVADPLGALGQAQATVTVTAATTTTLTSASGTYGSARLTAAVTAVGAVPAGQVTFSEGASVLGSAALDATGHAALAAATLAAGTHSLVASFTGSAGFLASASPVTAFTVAQEPTLTTLATAGLDPGTGSLSLTATVDCAAGTPTGPVAFLDGATPLGTVALVGHTATLAVTGLVPGHHAFTCGFQGSPNFLASTSAVVPLDLLTTTTVLTSTSGTYGATLLTAQVSSGGAIPAGTVTFSEAGASLGSAALDAAGVAALTTGGLHAGLHQVVASFTGSGGFLASAAPAAAFTVAPEPTGTTLATSGLSPATEAITLSATVGCAAGTATGPVAFMEGATLLATVALSGGTAAWTVTSPAPGSHTFTCVFQGSPDFLGSTSAAVTLAPLATTTAFTATGGTFGATRLTARVSAGGATPAGAVTFLEGSAVLGSAGLDGGGQAVLAAPGLEAGSHVLVAQFNGNRAFLASASSATGLQVDPAATGVTLGSDSPSLPSGAVATLTATVTSLAGIPTGTVVFLDGSDPLGTVPLSGNIAVCSARLRPGSRSLTAVFQGSRDYLASTSATLAMAVTLSFSLAPEVTRVNLDAGQTASLQVTVSAAGAPTDPVILHCLGLPPGLSATFTPAQVPADGLAAPVTVTLTLGPAGAQALAGRPRPDGGPWPWLALVCGLAAVPGAGRRRRPWTGFLLVACAIMLAGLAACGGGGGGGGGNASPVPQTRSYPLVLTADSPGAAQATANLTLDLTS